MSEWADLTLGDVLTLQRGFDLPQRKRRPGPYPVVSSAGFTGVHDEFKVEPPGVVIGRYGSLGTVHWVVEPFWPLNTALWVKDFKGNDPRFVSYLLKTVTVDSSTASAVPGVNRNHLHKQHVRVPPVRLQRRIAALLSTLDELVEINERRIDLLEDLARSLYREWFVHFRLPGRSEVELVDSGTGESPKGWEVCSVNEVVSTLTRGVAPKYAEDGAWTVVNQRCIRDQRVGLVPARRHGGKVSDVKRVRAGDVLVNSTGVGTLGRVAVLSEERENLTADSHVTILRARSANMHAWFGRNMIDREAAFQAMGTGSTGQTELGRAALGELPIIVPPDSVLNAFNEVVEPLLRFTPILLRSQDQLARSRDLLLPRLVTGQLDISDIDLGILTPVESE